MTVIAGHLHCDAFDKWCHCRDAIWSSDKHKEVLQPLKYFHCECGKDILCEKGVGIKYEHTNGTAQKIYFCQGY